jgi:DNA recombination protein RmuC
MGNEVFTLLAGVLGLCVGIITTWLVFRSKFLAIEIKAKADVGTELATLHEQLKRVNAVESECNELKKLLTLKQDDFTRVNTQLNERTNTLENIEKSSRQTESDSKELQIKLDNLQKNLQDATNKIAALTEQSSRVFGLEQELTQKQENLQNLSAQVSELTAKLDASNHEVDDANKLKDDIKSMHEIAADLRQRLGVAESALTEQRNQFVILNSEKIEVSEKKDNLLIEQQELTNKLAELTAKLDAEQKQGLEKITLLNDAKEELSDKFKTLATEILEEKSKRFAEQNQTSLGQLLEPLKIQLQDFKGKVEEVYVQEGKDRSALAEQLKTMMSLNQQLSKDADNLTRALKGDNKAQGNWGELMLERILDTSGLRKGHEYDVQESHKREDGSRLQPDVVIHLPEDKHLIVDSKVSIVAYNDYISAESDVIKNAALKRHVDSFKMHIKGLSEKNYQHIHGVKSLDFVLMFVPVESAFMLAVANDNELWQEAWKKNVLLVSPSTLLFVIRTVAHLWKQEQQSKNAQEIAKRGADLYDKIVGFVGDMNDLGTRLKQASDSYDKAFNKLSKGRGNVMRQAEMLKDLGVKPTKQLNVEQLDDITDVKLLE